jgi:hypothetical protein
MLTMFKDQQKDSYIHVTILLKFKARYACNLYFGCNIAKTMGFLCNKRCMSYTFCCKEIPLPIKENLGNAVEKVVEMHEVQGDSY